MVVSTILPLRRRKPMWKLVGVNQVEICTKTCKKNPDNSVALKNINALIVLCTIK